MDRPTYDQPESEEERRGRGVILLGLGILVTVLL
jgi:hypothetical protein